jgi:hypothetical protein
MGMQVNNDPAAIPPNRNNLATTRESITIERYYLSFIM